MRGGGGNAQSCEARFLRFASVGAERVPLARSTPPPDPHLFGHADLGQRRFRLFFDEFMVLNREFMRDWLGRLLNTVWEI